MPDLRSGNGFAAAEWAVALGLLILPMVMVVGSIAPWMARQTMAREVAQEAARVVALADDWESGAVRAERLAGSIVANYGLTVDDVELVDVRTEGGEVGFGRGSDVVVEVRVRIPALTVPGFGAVLEVWWHTEHTEHVDDFRSYP